MKKSGANRLVASLLGAYPAAHVNKYTAKVYAAMLEDLDYEEAERAVRALIAESKFMPTIAEIRGRVAEDAMPAAAPAELAWARVLRAVRERGIYRGAPDFDDPCTTRAVAVLGWRTICNADESEHGTMRAQFRDAYRQAYEQQKRGLNTERLLAHVDQKRLAGIHATGEGQEPDRRPRQIAGAVAAALPDDMAGWGLPDDS